MTFWAVALYHFLSEQSFDQSCGPEIFQNSEQKVFGSQLTASMLQSALDILMLPNKLCTSVSFILYGNQHLPQLFPPYYHLFILWNNLQEKLEKKGLSIMVHTT